MPRRKNGELPLPSGWEEGRDFDGKVFYINHNTHQTTWIDPRDQYTKPQSFSDCVGDELPYGWEEVYDPQVGVYFVDHLNQTNQLEDPRQQWHIEQEQMLKDYLVTAQDDLEAKKEIFSVKQQRLLLAQDEYQNLHDTLKGWKSSRTSLNSNSSVGSTKYDPDLIKADVILARKRVDRLRHELEQIRAEMQYKQRGLDTLAMVDQKLSGQETRYNLAEARQIMEEMQSIQKNLVSGQQEKQDLMQSLARLKEEFLKTRIGGSSPDVSTLSIPQEKLTTASQTDLRGEYGLTSSRYLAEITRLRLQYDDAKKKINLLKHQLADLEDDMVPGQNESDKDRLLLVQEKEQLLRELRSIDLRNRSEEEIDNVNQRISKLGVDLNHAKEISNKQIADRLRQQERKTEILSNLAETTKFATQLEAQLKGMSMSTLSMSSSSSLGSLGSLGSLSASSRGSLNSLSMLDIYSQQRPSDVDLQDLHRRVEKLLQGHSISPIHESPVSVAPDIMAAATSGYLQSVMASSQEILQPPPQATLKTTSSPHSSLSSLSPPISPYDMGPPPTSPYDMGPPPTYKQHMIVAKPPPPTAVPSLPQRPALNSSSNTPLQNVNITIPIQISSSQSKVVTESSPVLLQSKFESTVTETCSYSMQTSSSSTYQSETVETVYSQENVPKRTQYPESLDVISNPPLSPISESSSGVGNGGNTRSVSAAVSDESVAGDSGVFEASVKRDLLDEVLEMGLESAQIQIKLKYDPFETTLSVGVEQARNLTALQFPEGSKVCIKAALLPNPVASWETSPSTDVRNPKFNEVFRIVILERKLFTKTLQVNIWCLQDNRPDECAGCASVSLADFNAKEVSIRWYNVLSFKFMQSEATVPSKKSSSSSDSSVRENLLSQNRRPDSLFTGDNKDTVTTLLEASSAKLKGPESHKHPAVSTLKEESSDESTVISSQTSTLTRNQGADDMLGNHCDDTLKLDGSGEEMDEEDEMDYNELDMVEDVIRGFENTIDGICSSEGSTDQDDILAVETCNKETNTFQMKYPKALTGSAKSHHAIGSSRASAIRRSQTFSPACRQGDSYICKLNRSDSDSSMPLYKRGPFQRNSLERRSLRWKRFPSSLGFRGGKVVTRTSFDVELDLQASQTKLSHLNEENSRLRDLKLRLEEAKARGETELPPWMVDDEHFQKLLTDADKMRQREELGEMTKQERRAEALMKRVTRDIHRMKRSHPNALTTSFREKLAYITTVNMQVPVLPSETSEDVSQVEDLLKDGRMGHQV